MHRIELPHPRYTVLAFGSLPPEGVLLDYDPRRRPRPSKEQADALAADAERLRAEGLKVEARPLYRFLGYTCSPRMLLLKLGHCDYEQYLGLNRLHRDWGEGRPDLRADAVGLSAVCEGPEGAVLEVRSPQVAEAPGLLHVKPSGHAHPPQGLTEAVLEEAREELGLEEPEVEDLRCLGLVRVEGSDKAIVLYSMRTLVGLEEMRRRPRGEAWESDDLRTVSLEAGPLQEFLVEQGDRLTASGHAALLLEGWRRHGNEWLQATWPRVGGA